MKPAFYIEISLNQGADIPAPRAFAHVVEALHWGGVAGRFALGFPQQSTISTGGIMRVFFNDRPVADQAASIVMSNGVSFFLKPISVSAVPSTDVHYGFVAIKQLSPKQQRRRKKRIAEGICKHQPLSDSEMLAAVKKNNEIHESYPFLRLRSKSNKQYFSLYLKKVQGQPSDGGAINSYGLSKNIESAVFVPHW